MLQHVVLKFILYSSLTDWLMTIFVRSSNERFKCNFKSQVHRSYLFFREEFDSENFPKLEKTLQFSLAWFSLDFFWFLYTQGWFEVEKNLWSAPHHDWNARQAVGYNLRVNVFYVYYPHTFLLFFVIFGVFLYVIFLIFIIHLLALSVSFVFIFTYIRHMKKKILFLILGVNNEPCLKNGVKKNPSKIIYLSTNEN